jgi:hypothetical protein
MNAAWMMVLASLLFATMGVCVKLAAHAVRRRRGGVLPWPGRRGADRGLAAALRGGTLRTPVPGMHFWRSAVPA